MRRITLHAAVLATAAAIGCSSGGGEGGDADTTPPAAPVVSAPPDGATIDATELVAGQVALSGRAEAAATVELQVDGATTASGTVVATAGGTWSFAATLPSGGYTVRARATDAAGNVSGFSATVTFSVDGTRLAAPLPAGAPLPVTSFGQTIADTAGLPEAFPGQANTWVIDNDFSLSRGFGLQYHSALVLYTGTPTDAASHASLVEDVVMRRLAPFPGDQTADEAVFLTPLFGPADGVLTAVVSNGSTVGVPPLSGNGSAFLNGTSDSRLSRTLSLAAGRAYTLSWSDAVLLSAGRLDGAVAPPHAPHYQVVLRDAATGAQLGDPLFSTPNPSGMHTATLPAGLPPSVTLSFELRSAASGFAEIDDVALSDADGPVPLENGDFEGAALYPWTANAGAESQNVRSAPRTVGSGAAALAITRTFYAPPGASWGRLVDVFRNDGATAVSTTAVYLTMLYPAAPHVEAAGPSLVAWDPDLASRDVAVAAGNGAIVVQDGDPFAFTVHDLVVAPGEEVAVAHFVVQTGGAECAAVPRGSCPAADDAAAIAAGFPGDARYAADLEPGVADLVQNF